jgi:hypothetical protein
MTNEHRKPDVELAQEVLLDAPGFLRQIVERVLQELLETEMTKHIGAAPYERNGHRNGHKPRALRTRVGTLNLLVLQDHEGTFSTRLFARYQRNEKALVLALMEMYVEGVSTRKVAEVTGALCGTSPGYEGVLIRNRPDVLAHHWLLGTLLILPTSTSLANTAASDQRAEDGHDRGGDMRREVSWSHSVWLLHLASCLTTPLYNTTVCQALRRPLRSQAVSELLGTS